MQFRRWDVSQIFSNTKPTELWGAEGKKKRWKQLAEQQDGHEQKLSEKQALGRKLSILSASSRGHSSR